MHGIISPKDKLARTINAQSFARLRKRDAFRTFVLAYWPEKPAANLAAKLRCSERGAQLIINGERKVTARCIQVVINEMLPAGQQD